MRIMCVPLPLWATGAAMAFAGLALAGPTAWAEEMSETDRLVMTTGVSSVLGLAGDCHSMFLRRDVTPHNGGEIISRTEGDGATVATLEEEARFREATQTLQVTLFEDGEYYAIECDGSVPIREGHAAAVWDGLHRYHEGYEAAWPQDIGPAPTQLFRVTCIDGYPGQFDVFYFAVRLRAPDADGRIRVVGQGDVQSWGKPCMDKG